MVYTGRAVATGAGTPVSCARDETGQRYRKTRVAKNETKGGDEFRSWWKPLLDETVQRLIKAGAVSGAAVEAAPVWMAPNSILLARVWSAADKRNFIWAVSGPDVFPDHIAGNLAVDPQAAARHFSLKWQMDAERLRQIGAGRSGAQGERIAKQADELVRRAEMMYDLSAQDEIWRT